MFGCDSMAVCRRLASPTSAQGQVQQVRRGTLHSRIRRGIAGEVTWQSVQSPRWKDALESKRAKGSCPPARSYSARLSHHDINIHSATRTVCDVHRSKQVPSTCVPGVLHHTQPAAAANAQAWKPTQPACTYTLPQLPRSVEIDKNHAGAKVPSNACRCPQGASVSLNTDTSLRPATHTWFTQ